MLARSYIFSASPVFSVDDVVGIFPLVSHSDVRVSLFCQRAIQLFIALYSF